MKNIVKFKFQDKEGFLSIVEKEGRFYTLVQKDTPKVKAIEESHQLMISTELKTPDFKMMDVIVSYDYELISWVYKRLEEEKNLYFKELNDSLCVLEFLK